MIRHIRKPALPLVDIYAAFNDGMDAAKDEARNSIHAWILEIKTVPPNLQIGGAYGPRQDYRSTHASQRQCCS
jgi:hypothetical protein